MKYVLGVLFCLWNMGPVLRKKLLSSGNISIMGIENATLQRVSGAENEAKRKRFFRLL